MWCVNHISVELLKSVAKAPSTRPRSALLTVGRGQPEKGTVLTHPASAVPEQRLGGVGTGHPWAWAGGREARGTIS